VHFAVAAAVVDVGAEGRDFDDLAAVHDVRQAEAPADQPAIAEQRLDLLGRGVGGDVEVLRMPADQQVAHGAADEEGAEAAFAQAIEHAQRVGADVLARDHVRIARNRARMHLRDGGGIQAE
jgi:Asp-tRNA(Asn)/Glu-tRNA(Gln) amidotransferase A subunit family amidase